MHYLEELEAQVDKTHPRLGRMVAMAVLAAKARRALLLIAPPGTGKSQTLKVVSTSTERPIRVDSLTLAGLSEKQDELTGYRGIVVMDDLGKVNTPYARAATLTTLAELTYTHYANAHTGRMSFEVFDFFGTFMAGCQPNVLRPIIADGAWEATIADKTLRYWHLYRPQRARSSDIALQIQWGAMAEDCNEPDTSDPMFAALIDTALSQWSIGRAHEHTSWLLRAAATLDGRDVVTNSDVSVCEYLMRPMKAETHFIFKPTLDGERRVRTEFYYLVLELMSHGKLTASDIAQDFKVSRSTATELLKKFDKALTAKGSNPRVYGPSKQLKKIMEEIS